MNAIELEAMESNGTDGLERRCMTLDVMEEPMGWWSCTDENYCGEDGSLAGLGRSPKEAIEDYCYRNADDN